MFSFCKKKPWEKAYRHFHLEEFSCPCCGLVATHELMKWADELRDLLGKPMRINSGMRCDKHNKAVGGAPKSKHRVGIAMDVHCPDKEYQEQLKEIARANGAKGIGTYKTFLHLDLRDGPLVEWEGS